LILARARQKPMTQKFYFLSSQKFYWISRTWSHEFQPLPPQAFWIFVPWEGIISLIHLINEYDLILKLYFCFLKFFGFKYGFSLWKTYSQNKFPNFVTEICSALNFRPNEQTGYLNHFYSKRSFPFFDYFLNCIGFFVIGFVSNCCICIQANCCISLTNFHSLERLDCNPCGNIHCSL